ncbi:sensor histidine kinase [Nonomuraea sp. NPDC050643]|uniref:sensor histidine kinase n=1 Tax=Nonomuraea sp. NPDC050643 TaxID=3155660 RepID=UPI003411A2D9
MPPVTVSKFCHQALIYGSDQAFQQATTGFCLDGLGAGEKVLAVTTEANIALLRDSLGPDAGRVEFVMARDWYDSPGRTLSAYNRYVAVHRRLHGTVRIIGEPVWEGRTPPEENEWTRYESVLNAAFVRSPAWILCPYDARRLPAQIVADARRTHPHVVTGAGTRDSDAYSDPADFLSSDDRLPTAPPHAMKIPFDADLSSMRRRLSAHATELGMTAGQIESLVLAVNEVATNTVQSGAGHGDIALWINGPTVVCDVFDSSRLPSPLLCYVPPEPGAARGHGLWAVHQLCDLVQIRSGPEGTRFRLHLTIA